MRTKMLDVFEEHTRRWLKARAGTYPQHDFNNDEFLEQLLQRLSPDVPRRLGAALHRGYLTESPDPARGYFIGPPRGPFHYMLTQRDRRVSPCWEMFVHMAEYYSLRTLTDHIDELGVQIEDELMDLTVRHKESLLAYIEVKRDRQTAEKLLADLQSLASSGSIPERATTDAQKKANYILNAIPEDPSPYELYFSVRASGDEPEPIFSRRFRVIANRRERRLELHPLDRPVPMELDLRFAGSGAERARARVAWTVERGRADVWLSRGERRSSYNLYRSTSGGERILVGMQIDGRVYTDLASLEGLDAIEFPKALASVGLSLGPGKEWTYWTRVDGSPFKLEEPEADALARALISGLVVRSSAA